MDKFLITQCVWFNTYKGCFVRVIYFCCSVYRNRHSDNIKTSRQSSTTIDDTVIKSVDKESAPCPTKLAESAVVDSGM